MNSYKRPWGWYKVLYDEKFKVKLICINPGHRLSLQKHLNRDESWIDVRTNKFTFIPKGKLHRISNRGKSKKYVVELQTGRCDENDIIRLQDDYGRC